MVGMTEIMAGYQSLKSAKDILEAVRGIDLAVKLNDAKLDLQRHIGDAQDALFAAQQSQATLAKQVAELEQEVVQLKHWEAQKQRYELKDAGQGALAYALKPGVEPREPPHWICPQCYEDGKKSILKHEHLVAGRAEILVCHRCGLDLAISGRRAPPPTVIGSRIAPSTAPRRR